MDIMFARLIVLTLLAGIVLSQVNTSNEEKQWWYQACGKDQYVEVDLMLGFGYLEASAVGTSVIIDFKTKEAAFSFKDSSRCLVVPLDKDVFADSPANFEMKAARFSLNGQSVSSGDQSTFKKYKVVQKSAYFDPQSHFDHDASKDKIKSDLIVETCESMKYVATATLQPVTSSSDSDCPDESVKCLMTSKFCEASM